MSFDSMDTVTIYEVNGLKYTGAQKIDIKSHPRFLSFVRLCIDNKEYSLGADDLLRAVSHAIGQIQLAEDESVVGGSARSTHQPAEAQRSEEHDESTVGR